MNRLKIIREQAGLTQEEVAKTHKVTAQTIQRFEKGTRNISLSWLEKLAKTYGVRASALIDDVEAVEAVDADLDEALLREVLTYALKRCEGIAVDPEILSKVVCKTYKRCRKMENAPKKAQIKEKVDDMLTCVVD
ncbi:MAG TPA: hypothetical protein DCY07_07195 [Rhodospirillaceae bacterium]|nr:hypothetical protein [Rhodospirillaceae bacterium]